MGDGDGPDDGRAEAAVAAGGARTEPLEGLEQAVDVVITSTSPPVTISGYQAEPGRDPVTGWGTPDAQVLSPCWPAEPGRYGEGHDRLPHPEGPLIYELRTYHCLPGKLPELLARFQDLTLSVWERHQIRQVGFWTVVAGEASNDLIYLLAWDSLAEREERWAKFLTDPEWVRAASEQKEPLASMSSTLLRPTGFSAGEAGRYGEGHDSLRHREGPLIYELRTYHCIPGKLPELLARFQNLTLAIWERHQIRQVGFWTVVVGEASNDLIYMLAWESMAEREERWEKFIADPEWIRGRAATEENGPLVASVSNSLLRPTGFSAIQGWPG